MIILLASSNPDHLPFLNQLLADLRVAHRAQIRVIPPISPHPLDEQSVLDQATAQAKALHQQQNLKPGDLSLVYDWQLVEVGKLHNLQGLLVAWDGQSIATAHSGKAPLPVVVSQHVLASADLSQSLQHYLKTAPPEERPRLQELISQQNLFTGAANHLLVQIKPNLKVLSLSSLSYGIFGPHNAQTLMRLVAALVAFNFGLFAFLQYLFFAGFANGLFMNMPTIGELYLYSLILLILAFAALGSTHNHSSDVIARRTGLKITLSALVYLTTTIIVFLYAAIKPDIGPTNQAFILSLGLAGQAISYAILATTLWPGLQVQSQVTLESFTRRPTESNSLNLIFLAGLVLFGLMPTLLYLNLPLFFYPPFTLLPALWSWSAWDFIDRYTFRLDTSL